MYVGQLITDLIRPKTGNLDYSRDSTTGVTVEGISTDLIVSFINDALCFIQSRIIAVYPGEFVEDFEQNTVPGVEAYYVDDNVFLNNKILSVRFTENGDTERYFPLPPATLVNRDTRSGSVYQYIKRNGGVLLNKIPNRSDSLLNISYYRALDRLDIRRGTIASKTLTTIVLSNDTILDNFALGNAQYICIVDKFGNVKDYNIPITSYNSATRTITIASQALVGIAANYVVVGEYTSTHIDPTKRLQRLLDYCKVFAQARMYNTDASIDEINERVEVKDILTDIVDQFTEMTEDSMGIPILDDMLDE